ncbi:site-specific DNA-methytransferase [Bordetella phage vB_BbrM_PHB04]|uniref:site-specific DNA-methyltransferase (cytosine-N(4)-specific) n=1 Tax=Bordetella phage vB_BbrM_PHB04 TaxID=2029657 RepID=A0A291LAN5_9CAUD|nr:DNA methyltransferase [Bordetella phage vB_BbrM_PHB04]ATI15668.1 site-specific DNA-methytransferase [Bordetella phage vB_BbrM_PHB04]
MNDLKLDGATVLLGDCIQRLKELPDCSVQMCVTSPPYFGLRDYGVDGQIGLEETPDAYIAKMVDVFREVRRVLADDGTLWLNIGDSYASTGGQGKQSGPQFANRAVGKEHVTKAARYVGGDAKPKDLIGIPWMLAFALRADGWYLRQDIIWHKPNPMPESVRDRCTKAHEYVFLLSKSERYFYDAEAVKEPAVSESPAGNRTHRGATADAAGELGHRTKAGLTALRGVEWVTRNRRSVWTVPTRPYKGAHFAVFPPALVEPCILAGSRPGDAVLDPFNGSGTTGQVAIEHGREYVGIELNPEYVDLTRQRLDRAIAERDAAIAAASPSPQAELFGSVA